MSDLSGTELLSSELWVNPSKLAHFAHLIWPTSMTLDAGAASLDQRSGPHHRDRDRCWWQCAKGVGTDLSGSDSSFESRTIIRNQLPGLRSVGGES
jgi:hypothetical protein